MENLGTIPRLRLREWQGLLIVHVLLRHKPHRNHMGIGNETSNRDFYRGL
jgi:hypothetical protein